MRTQAGSALTGIIIIVVILLAGGYFFWKSTTAQIARNKALRQAESSQSASVIESTQE